MKKRELWIILVSILSIILSTVVITSLRNKLEKSNTHISILVNNNSAYELEIQNLSNERGAYKMTIAEMSKSNDSLITMLHKTRIELGIKDKELQQAFTFKSEMSEILTDTIFQEYRDTVNICNFDMTINFNIYTSVHVSVQDSLLTASIDMWDRYQVFDYSRKEWKEPKFFKRLVKFQWGKYTFEKYQMVNENKLNKIRDFKVIKVHEN